MHAATSSSVTQPPATLMDFGPLPCPGISSAAQPDAIDVGIERFLDKDSYKIQRISFGKQPHWARFNSEQHAILIFDRGSCFLGERSIGRARWSATLPSPIDIGVDFVPAQSELVAVAEDGSNVVSNLVLFGEELLADIFGARVPHKSPQPVFNMSGGLLFHLASRLRDLCRGDAAVVDELHVENVLTLLIRETLLAGSPSTHQRRTAGLSTKARRIARDFLHANFDKKIDMTLLARQIGVSRYYFARAFTATFGIAPHQYLLRLRIRKAAELLGNSRLSVTEIALMVGFSSSSEFSRTFRATMGHTPREFRHNSV